MTLIKNEPPEGNEEEIISAIILLIFDQLEQTSNISDPYTQSLRALFQRYPLQVVLAEMRNIVKGIYFPERADDALRIMEYRGITLMSQKKQAGYYTSFTYNATVYSTPIVATTFESLERAQQMIDQLSIGVQGAPSTREYNRVNGQRASDQAEEKIPTEPMKPIIGPEAPTDVTSPMPKVPAVSIGTGARTSPTASLGARTSAKLSASMGAGTRTSSVASLDARTELSPAVPVGTGTATTAPMDAGTGARAAVPADSGTGRGSTASVSTEMEAGSAALVEHDHASFIRIGRIALSIDKILYVKDDSTAHYYSVRVGLAGGVDMHIGSGSATNYVHTQEIRFIGEEARAFFTWHQRWTLILSPPPNDADGKGDANYS